MKIITKCLPAAALGLSLLSGSALADWTVDNKQSGVFFISTKNLNVSEVHHFTSVEGSLTKTGSFTLDIDLASVETGIEIRNTRMREMLFNVASFPKAQITASIAANVMSMSKGHSQHLQIPASLSVMGKEKALELDVIVSRNSDDSFVVVSAKPLLIGAADVGLKEGVEALQKIAGLSSIGLTVPVTFNLTLKAD